MASQVPQAVLKLNPLSENETLDPHQTPESHNHYADRVAPHFHTVSIGIQHIWGPQIDVHIIDRSLFRNNQSTFLALSHQSPPGLNHSVISGLWIDPLLTKDQGTLEGYKGIRTLAPII